MNDVAKSKLGKNVEYKDTYSPDLLYPIARQAKRSEIGLSGKLPFHGGDLWNAYEVSWLNLKGKPEVRLAQFYFPFDSQNIIESKSFKLYLNSFNQSKFSSAEEVTELLKKDLSQGAQIDVDVKLFKIHEKESFELKFFEGSSLDELDIEINTYQIDPNLLATKQEKTSEKLYSHLLKSNCLVTGQPDWASLFIKYEGNKIVHESLLSYIVSFRQHNEFHEQCVERIFNDILNKCAPEKLTVYARYTRRGGLDINPFRSNFESFPGNIQLPRQ